LGGDGYATIVSTMDINSLDGVHSSPKASGAIATFLLTASISLTVALAKS